MSVEAVLKLVQAQPTKQRIMRALPEDDKDIRKMPRAWINNVVYTLDERVSEWVQDVQSERAAKIIAE